MTSRYCRDSQHWACYGRAGHNRDACICDCHAKKEEVAIDYTKALMAYLLSVRDYEENEEHKQK